MGGVEGVGTIENFVSRSLTSYVSRPLYVSVRSPEPVPVKISLVKDLGRYTGEGTLARPYSCHERKTPRGKDEWERFSVGR